MRSNEEIRQALADLDAARAVARTKTYRATFADSSTETIPGSAWLGIKDGKIVTWFASRNEGDTALRRRRVDSTTPLVGGNIDHGVRTVFPEA